MLALLSAIPARLIFAALGLAGALLLLYGLYALGERNGRQRAAVEALERAVEAYETRQEIDDEVDSADLLDICIELGGMPDACREQLRRVDETSGGE